MATTTKGISFEELEGSPRIRIAADGVTATRSFKVAWADYVNFAKELVGNWTITGGTPDFEEAILFPGDLENLYVDGLDIEPFETTKPTGSSVTTLTSGTNTYDGGAKVSVTYKQRPDDTGARWPSGGEITVPTQTFLTYKRSAGVEFLTVPEGGWRWDSDNAALPPEVPVGIITVVTNHHLTWHNVTRPPYTAIRKARGKVNSATFFGAGAGTLLFLGDDMDTKFQIGVNVQRYELTYTFAEKWNTDDVGAGTYGWNHMWRAGNFDPHWQLVESNNGEVAGPFFSYDFTGLFSYEP